MWHYKNLGDAMLAGPELNQIKHSAGANLRLFVRYITKYGLYCEVIVYFPPEAKSVAKQCLATPCVAPNESDLTTL
ncbi:hypothetical protein [Pseudoalteromonas prydzensis]|uniref:hypothetical protein n=1 Tax=Pseudoalteromonas prydzensis TaxID=182141 RepID=UPI0007E50EAB|nr:hypothetical protein [Pseudoalteromonas prydzensis]MBE0376938.1 hypothetical protein [Pseudoalteromonas prydzensis ACAM 620]